MKSVLRMLPVIATRRRLFLETVLWSVVAQTSTVVIALGIAFAVGRVVAGEPISLDTAAIVLVAVALLAAAAAWRESWVGHDLAYRLLGELRSRVFASLRRALPARRERKRTGDLVTTTMNDVETLEWLYAHTAAQSLSALVVLSGSAAVSVTITPLLLFAWVPLLVIGVAVPLATAKRATRDGDALAEGAASIRSELLDTVRGLRELRGADALGTQLGRLSRSSQKLAGLQVREASRIGLERAIADAIFAVAALAAICIVLLDDGAIAPSAIPLAVTVSVAGLGPAAQIADLLRSAGTLRASARRIGEVLDQEPSVGTVRRQATPTTGAGRMPSASEEGLVFDGVNFGFGEGLVLKEFALAVRPGETVALVGPSGVGKTTVARLALRLWDPDAGGIRIDGDDLRGMPDNALRGLISIVPQSSPLLRGTIRSNILLADPDAAPDAITEAAATAGLLDPAVGLPIGLETPVGEYGTGLSGGQRARVAIARAVLRRPRVLVLDEATASLDQDADAAVMELLNRSSTRATLVIAHRPETIAAADRVVALPGARE